MKRMLSFIAIILVFLGYAFFAGSTPSSTAKNDVAKVGLLQLMDQPALKKIQQGIYAGLKSSGYTVGKNLEVDYQNAQGNQSNLKTMSEKFINEDADLAIGITTPASISLANATTSTPVLMSGVTDPKSASLVQNLNHPEKNVTGVSDQAPLQEQLQLIQKLMPNLKTLGVIYTSSDNSAVTQYHKFKKLATAAGIKLKVYSIANSNDLNQVSQTMVQSVDAVFVPTDNTIAGAMSTLVKNANAANVPIFPAVDSMVKAGGVATYSVNQYQLGVLTGKMAARILKGEKVKNTPIEYIKHGDLTINLKQAKKLGITIPDQLIQKAQQKGVLIQ
jgi:putative ABC transport system substrate-binding protein